VSDKLKTN